MLTRSRSPLCFIALIALITIFADQISKWWVIEHVLRAQPTIGFIAWLSQAGERVLLAPIGVMPFFNVVMVWNKGISFGMLQGHDTLMPYVLSVMGALVAAGFLWWGRQTTSRVMQISIGFIVGGALGNIWDRLRFGAVADFLDVYIGDHHWPAFNIADSAITVGVVLLMIHLLLEKPASPVSNTRSVS